MQKNKIPKIIHYIWIGDNKKPDSVIKCIDSWKKYCPDYEIREWNEKNLDIDSNKFMKQAYKNKKWAFVTDVARYKIIYDCGGIYLDTDVEIIKPFDDLLTLNAFMGFEGTKFVASGLGFGGSKGFPMFKELFDMYNDLDFNMGEMSKITTPVMVTNYLKKKGLVCNGDTQVVEGLKVFSDEYFNPKNAITRFINITPNTYSIHHYDASWTSGDERKFIDKIDSDAKELQKKQKDKVSIIIPVYNGHKYVKKAIDSALAQTYKNIEIIVVNDGSSDNTEEIVLAYGNLIRYYYKENGGVASALNYGISKAKGKYISWLSHDDEYEPEKIEKQVEHIHDLKDKKISICNWVIIDEESEIVEEKNINGRIERNVRAFLAFDRKTWLNGCALLIPKSVFEDVGLFDESLPTTQDYDLWFRMSEKYEFRILEDHLMRSRAHAEQGSLSAKNALNDSDKMHYKIIKSLSDEEIDKYFENDKELYSVFYSFFNNGYVRAPSLILKYMLDRAFKNNNMKEIFKISNIAFGKADYVIYDLYKLKQEKNKLLFVSGYWWKGGVERVLSTLFANIDEKYKVLLLIPDKNINGYPLPDRVIGVYLNNNVYLNHFDFTIFFMYEWLNLDLVVGCMNLMDKLLDYYLLIDGTNHKAIASNHEYFLYPYRTSLELANKRIKAFKNIKKAIWLTQFSNNAYSNFYSNGVVIYNPNTFELDDEINKNRENVILCVGRFYDKVKRVDRTLRIYSKVLKEIPDAKLYLVGSYDYEKIVDFDNNITLKELIHQLNLDDADIVFFGEQEDMTRFYKMAKVLLLPSENEGFPMVVNEAAAFGVPTVVSYYPGVEDLVINGYNGYCCNQNNLDDYVDKIVGLLTDDNKYNTISKNAISNISKFDKKIIVKEWEKLIDEVLNDDNNKTDIVEEKELGNNDSVLISELFSILTGLSDGTIKSVNEKENDNPDYENLLKEFNSVCNSKSWKITKPLRKISSIMRGKGSE